jgi:uncharacterized membrane protein YdjX (TVP38/TMEM64 family)
MDKKQLALIIAGILSLIGLILIFLSFNPYEINSAVEFISKHIIAGIIFLIFLRTLSNVLPIFPGGMIAFASVPILGWFTAFMCNLIGLFLGKSIAFFLARIYREPLVERFATLNKIHQLEKQATGKKQFATLVVFKLFTVPVVDISSYIVGLTKISYLKFAVATILAALPTLATFYFGNKLYEIIFGKNLFIGVATILIAGSIYFVIKIYNGKLKNKL